MTQLLPNMLLAGIFLESQDKMWEFTRYAKRKCSFLFDWEISRKYHFFNAFKAEVALPMKYLGAYFTEIEKTMNLGGLW